METLTSTEFLDHSHPIIQDFVVDFLNRSSDQEKAVGLYYKVRDGQVYNPYHLNLQPLALRASTIVQKKSAWCVEKSILLATAARALGIPSKLGFAIVRNHLESEKLLRYLRKEEIVFHGYVSLQINERWVRCTPAFDRRICRISGVAPLDFDGVNDSMFQAFSGSQRFMEYLHYYGEFDDLPIELMRSEMRIHYPHLFETKYNDREFSFIY